MTDDIDEDDLTEEEREEADARERARDEALEQENFWKDVENGICPWTGDPL